MPFLILKWFFPFFQGLLLGLVAMTLHEAGHLIAALAVGIKVKNVGFCWKGMYTVREPGPPVKNILLRHPLCPDRCTWLPKHGGDRGRMSAAETALIVFSVGTGVLFQ